MLTQLPDADSIRWFATYVNTFGTWFANGLLPKEESENDPFLNILHFFLNLNSLPHQGSFNKKPVCSLLKEKGGETYQELPFISSQVYVLKYISLRYMLNDQESKEWLWRRTILAKGLEAA